MGASAGATGGLCGPLPGACCPRAVTGTGAGPAGAENDQPQAPQKAADVGCTALQRGHVFVGSLKSIVVFPPEVSLRAGTTVRSFYLIVYKQPIWPGVLVQMPWGRSAQVLHMPEVMRPMSLLLFSVNHRFLSGPAVMATGTVPTGSENTVICPLGVMRSIWLWMQPPEAA